MTTSLHDYASRGKLEKIIEKVGKGRSINRREPTYLNTVIVVAAACGHLNVVNWLIEQKADLNTPEVHGWTALHLAALKGHDEIAAVLIKAGIDVAAKDLEGKTARDLAASPPDWVPQEAAAVEGRAKIVSLLPQ